MRKLSMFRWLSVLLMMLGLSAGAVPSSGTDSEAETRDVAGWLQRMHDAARGRAYTGTLVVTSGASISTSRIWHVCDGKQQIERVEALSGLPRSTFRRNDEVITFAPHTRVAVLERRELLRPFPQLRANVNMELDRHYAVQVEGRERVAGVDADVVHLLPRDALRYGYRVWSETRTGLVVKVQTLARDGVVLEQVAFSELQLDAPVSMERLSRMMDNTGGYRVETTALQKTTPQAEGWRMSHPVPGFSPVHCYRRAPAAAPESVQWVFSDGLATVSIFMEAYDSRRHGPEGLQGQGATHALTRRVVGRDGAWWLTLVGEVPVATLQAFTQALERAP